MLALGEGLVPALGVLADVERGVTAVGHAEEEDETRPADDGRSADHTQRDGHREQDQDPAHGRMRVEEQDAIARVLVARRVGWHAAEEGLVVHRRRHRQSWDGLHLGRRRREASRKASSRAKLWAELWAERRALHIPLLGRPYKEVARMFCVEKHGRCHSLGSGSSGRQ